MVKLFKARSDYTKFGIILTSYRGEKEGEIVTLMLMDEQKEIKIKKNEIKIDENNLKWILSYMPLDYFYKDLNPVYMI